MIVAEIGQNHLGNMDIAKRMIYEAAEGGADFVKLQLYDADKVYGVDSCYYKYGKMAELSEKQFEYLLKIGDIAGIEVFASVFDLDRFEWCEQQGVKRYKIAARMRDKELLEAVAKTRKPVFISVDPRRMDSSEIVTLDIKFKKLTLLYCVSKYPAYSSDIKFPNFDDFWEGFSDHSLGIDAALCALGKGAKVIEKHFTLDKFANGFDHLWSMTPEELRKLKRYEEVIKENYGESREWVRKNG